ncbi:TlpA family protein disulfide reductase [Aureibaculum luteum]|uniref:TlpA family protein disulfide reductase n=1 Tax=Aureibaculum luteum TaxID=1548456 RepID=UPI000E52A07A|nr:TlpA disulfide reductase family protein [Aureibaculum luteum]
MIKNSIPLFIVTLLLSISVSCNKQKTTNTTEKVAVDVLQTEIPVYDFNQLEPLLYTESDKIYIVNFWAMWCAPCVKELPYLQEFATQNPEIELILVSLDFTKDIETKLKPFLKKNNITEKVVLLDDPDANAWIDKIDPNWSGAIPFTIIFNNKKRLFFERAFEDLKDLENEINKIRNH